MEKNIVNLLEKIIFVFDWDGTIFDSMNVKYYNFSVVLALIIKEHYKINISKNMIRDFYIELSGIPRIDIFRKICSRLNIEYQKETYDFFSLSLSEKNREDLLKSKVFLDSVNFIKYLLGKNKTVYISSSVPENELRYLVKNKLDNKVFKSLSGVYGSSNNFNKGKEHFDFIVEKEKVKKKNIVFFGDDFMDLKLGESYGIDTILINRNEKKTNAKNVVTSFERVRLEKI